MGKKRQRDSRPGTSEPLRREQALAAVPVRTQVLRVEERDNGGLLLTVQVRPPRWHRWLGADTPLERSFGLDSFGREVYEMCDGRRTVRDVIAEFARRHRLEATEAELAVTRFLRLLMRKGLIALAVPRQDGTALQSEAGDTSGHT